MIHWGIKKIYCIGGKKKPHQIRKTQNNLQEIPKEIEIGIKWLRACDPLGKYGTEEKNNRIGFHSLASFVCSTMSIMLLWLSCTLYCLQHSAGSQILQDIGGVEFLSQLRSDIEPCHRPLIDQILESTMLLPSEDTQVHAPDCIYHKPTESGRLAGVLSHYRR